MNINFEEQIAAKTNEELIEIFTNQEHYQPSFVENVKKEIIKRNIPINAVEKIKQQKENIESQVLALGKQGNPIYMALIAGSAIFGGIIAIVGGYIYAYSKHTDGNGERYFVYNESTRKWGRIIFGVGLAVLVLISLIKLDSY